MLMGFYLHISAPPELGYVFSCNGRITMVLAKVIILSHILKGNKANVTFSIMSLNEKPS